MKNWKSTSVEETLALIKHKCSCGKFAKAARYHAGPYVVCTCGTLWNPDGRRLNPTKVVDGYIVAAKGMIHCIVWESFNGPVPEGLILNHKDGDKHNPKLSNLESCTYSENALHAYRLGLSKPVVGELNGMAKLSDVEHRSIQQLIRDGHTNEEISDMYLKRITPGHVCSLRLGTRRAGENHVVYPSLGKIKHRYNFNLEEILEIYFLCRYTNARMREISEAYGVDRSTCSRIRNGILWTMVEPYYDYHHRQRLSQPPVRDAITSFELVQGRHASRAAS